MPRVDDFASSGEQACLNESPELFFSGDPEDIVEAKLVCHGCPVVAACRTAAIARKEKYGIWGGTTAEERKDINARAAARRRRSTTREKSAA